MIITMIAMRVVQVAIDEIIEVVAVWNRRMTTIGTVLVTFLMSAAVVCRRAVGRIGGIDGQKVFLDFAVGHVMQMAVVQIVDMTFVKDARVTAIGTVFVRMPFVSCCHFKPPQWLIVPPALRVLEHAPGR